MKKVLGTILNYKSIINKEAWARKYSKLLERIIATLDNMHSEILQKGTDLKEKDKSFADRHWWIKML